MANESHPCPKGMVKLTAPPWKWAYIDRMGVVVLGACLRLNSGPSLAPAPPDPVIAVNARMKRLTLAPALGRAVTVGPGGGPWRRDQLFKKAGVNATLTIEHHLGNTADICCRVELVHLLSRKCTALLLRISAVQILTIGAGKLAGRDFCDKQSDGAN
ncbi:hypothetical protein Aple_037850 [Acrocarpospora pleiomorpha]|uniref:Uncharacterized protein n=1 Tax=Acrocarpospora pleiomorpha TaxID=90975 RepID=A0A5M3XL48_9ACTN|nr:hypothetical protein Aple_037850 [Acrocarpospora pleiomorpha]